MDIQFLKKIGFSDKESQVYLALLRLGPSSVRKLAEFCDLNRGTVYECLKELQGKGMVNFFDKDSKQHFVAENPDHLSVLIQKQQADLQKIDKDLGKIIPELQALHNSGGERPVARYYEKKDLHGILEDVLSSCEQTAEQEYRIYSAEGVRKYLYESFPTFSDVRIGKGISVRVIALGQGGELRGLDERKWLKTGESDIPETYILIYPGKTAYISLNAVGEPIGVVIENKGVSETQKIIFDSLWKSL